MSNLIWDIDDDNFIFELSNNMAMDSNGNMMMRMSDNTAMDIDSGDIHFTSPWNNEENDE